MSVLSGMSSVKIGNMALANIGWTGTIESLNEESTEAKQIKLWYDYCRVLTLDAIDWKFARKRAALSLSTDDPPDDWGVRYQYPADCIKMRKIVHPMGDTEDYIEFDVENDDAGTAQTIVTDLEDAVGYYTFNLTQVNQFSAPFIEALAWAIAAKIAFPITKKRDLKKDCEGNWLATLRIAEATDGNEGVARKPREAEAVRGR